MCKGITKNSVFLQICIITIMYVIIYINKILAKNT